MTLAALAPTTDGSEGLATDTFGIVVPSQHRRGDAFAYPEPDPGQRVLLRPTRECELAADAEASRTNGRIATKVCCKIALDGKRPITEGAAKRLDAS